MVKCIGKCVANGTIVLGTMLGAIMFCGCVLCMFTPHKTKYNEFTDVYKYWLDDAYFCKNFDCPVQKQ